MTVVGKILVFLNLVFSLVVGAFAVMSHMAGTDHAKAIKIWEARFTALDATRKVSEQENEALRAEKTAFLADFGHLGHKDIKDEKNAVTVGAWAVKHITRLGNQVTSLEEQLKTANDAKKAADKERTASANTGEAATEANRRREKEVKDMRVALTTVSKKNGELARDLSKEMDIRVRAELDAMTLKEQNKNLESQQRDLLRETARQRNMITNLESRLALASSSRSGGGGSFPARVPGGQGGGVLPLGPAGGGKGNEKGLAPNVPGQLDPPGGGGGGMGRGRNNTPVVDNVEGSIRRVDGNLVTISVGSDSGLVRGNMMEVFRLGKNPKYVGKVKIVEVTAKSGVGQVVGKLNTTIQVGDRVANKILGGY